MLGENHPDYAASLNNLAMLYQAMGDYAKAEPLFRQALEIRKKALGENHPDYATSLNNLAVLYQAMGDYAKAEPLYRQALEIQKQALGENHPDYATQPEQPGRAVPGHGRLREGRAALPPGAGDPQAGAGREPPRLCQQPEQPGRAVLRPGSARGGRAIPPPGTDPPDPVDPGGLATLGERQRLRLLAAQGGTLNAYLSVAPAAGIKAEDIYRHVLAWKGVVEARQDEDRLARDQPELKETLEQLDQARARLAHLAFTTPPAGQRQAWRQQLDALRDRKENLEGDLARKSGAFRQVQQTRRLGAAEVAAALPAGIALVDLLDYVHYSPPEGGKGPLRRESRLVAFVLRRGQAPVLVPLGASRPIDEAVRAWRQALVAGTPEPMQAAAELSRRVWEPLRPHLDGATTVLVAPDGALVTSPSPRCPGTGPAPTWSKTWPSATSARRTGWSRRSPRRVRPSPRAPRPTPPACWPSAASTSRPTPAARLRPSRHRLPACSLAESQRAGFRALAGTEPEVRRIAQLFDAAFPDQHALVLTGAAPTEAEVKQQLDAALAGPAPGHPRLLRVAGAGRRPPGRPEVGRLRPRRCREVGGIGIVRSDAAAALGRGPGRGRPQDRGRGAGAQAACPTARTAS